ncbi:hypothetical protein [Catellatospora sp. NPDC049609]|uniref:hypothetical protein n=1 Tax=Catellatospora sp. NPDC049609 TaxID=3155505 RepID=UPI0034176A99
MHRSVRTAIAVTLLSVSLAGLVGCQGQLREGTAPNGQPAPIQLPPADDSAAQLVAAVGTPTGQLRAKKIPKMGAVVTDGDGWVLYRFDRDSADPPESRCSGDCAAVWPPVLVDESLELTGVDRKLVGTIEREDGSTQVTLAGWPLYRYIGDLKAGQWKGQGVGGVWFVVAPTGKKNLSCLPTGTPKAVPPPSPAVAPSPEAGTSPEAAASPAVAASPDGGGYTY